MERIQREDRKKKREREQSNAKHRFFLCLSTVLLYPTTCSKSQLQSHTGRHQSSSSSLLVAAAAAAAEKKRDGFIGGAGLRLRLQDTVVRGRRRGEELPHSELHVPLRRQPPTHPRCAYPHRVVGLLASDDLMPPCLHACMQRIHGFSGICLQGRISRSNISESVTRS